MNKLSAIILLVSLWINADQNIVRPGLARATCSAQRRVSHGTAYQGDPRVQRARRIRIRPVLTDQLISGMLRLREHTLFHNELAIEDYGKVLKEVFPSVA